MWADFSLENPPEQLAHYTSLASLEKILSSRELWLSNPLYMNDWEELRFGMQEGATAFRTSESIRESCSTDERFDHLINYFNSLYLEFESDHALDCYVLCLSEHTPSKSDGVLSMWRGYGEQGSGAALLFNTNAFPRYEHLPLMVGQVVYATKPARRAWLSERVSAIAKEISRFPVTDENLEAAAHTWFERLKVFAIFTKHEGFQEEREWRVVYMKERDPQKALTASLGYSIGPRGVEPKLKLSLDVLTDTTEEKSSLDSLIGGILLGPSLSSALAQASIRRMVELLKLPVLAGRITASQIPFRS